jgi:hypothetical protein
VPGKTEEECEMIQSQIEQFRRQLGVAQQRVNESKGQDKTAEIVRDNLRAQVNAMQLSGEVNKFERWKHERHALKEYVKRAEVKGCKVEFRQPARMVAV